MGSGSRESTIATWAMVCDDSVSESKSSDAHDLIFYFIFCFEDPGSRELMGRAFMSTVRRWRYVSRIVGELDTAVE